MLEEEIVANPFHALAGAFDVDMIENSEETGTEEIVSSIEAFPPSPCKPNKLAPETNVTVEPTGKCDETNPKPAPNPTEGTHSRAKNLALNNLLEAVQTVNASDLHELEKILVIPGVEENEKMLKDQDDDFEQIASPDGEESNERRRQLPTGTAWAEVEEDSDGETELENSAAKETNVESGTGETRTKGEVNLALTSMMLAAVLEEDTLAEAAADPSEESDKCNEHEDTEEVTTGGEQRKSGSAVIFMASKTGGRCVTVGDSQRRPGSWSRRRGGYSRGPGSTPNAKEGFSGSEESDEDEPNLAEGTKLEEPLIRSPGERSKGKSRSREFPVKAKKRWRNEVELAELRDDKRRDEEQDGRVDPEMLSPEMKLVRTLQRIMPGATIVVDYKENGEGDAVLLCHNSLTVLDRGCSGKGFAAWMRVRTEVGIVGVVSLHAPNGRSSRAKVWTWLRQLIREGQWIIMGDLNMVEQQADSIGPSPLIRGDELHSWERCTGGADLVDARLCASKIVGPHFT
ncbi:hypothetical protein R1sor_001700 [Riccia sorocarpa]|uniref:Uncharacterized protein n=1 Tax=Riccia sorocarpa TaxID=122646 RepID=A0ABD3GXI9_9MARC